MSSEDELVALIDFVYAAVLDGDLWPAVLAKLADATGTMQSIIATMDRRTNYFDSISRRTIAELDTSYKNYWAFHNPLWFKSAAQPAGTIYTLDSLMPRQDFVKTPIFNEWWKSAEYSLAMLGTNLQADDRVLSLLCIINGPRNDALTKEQTHLFQATSRHVARAVRICRRLWTAENRHVSPVDRFEGSSQGALLTDAAANVLFINAAARATLAAGDGLILKGENLDTSDGTDGLRRLIASCAYAIGPLHGPFGGKLKVQRGPHRAPLELVVTPFRSKNPAVEIPWLGLRAPVAIVTMSDPEINRRQLVQDLRDRFELTAAEAELAMEIVKGDGRKAAAKRRGISVTTVRSQLSSIFEKTGTHRQAELVHLLLELDDKRSDEKCDVRAPGLYS